MAASCRLTSSTDTTIDLAMRPAPGAGLDAKETITVDAKLMGPLDAAQKAKLTTPFVAPRSTHQPQWLSYQPKWHRMRYNPKP